MALVWVVLMRVAPLRVALGLAAMADLPADLPRGVRAAVEGASLGVSGHPEGRQG